MPMTGNDIHGTPCEEPAAWASSWRSPTPDASGATAVALRLFLILSLDLPYTGDVGVGPSATCSRSSRTTGAEGNR
jgi:hypothetical protein